MPTFALKHLGNCPVAPQTATIFHSANANVSSFSYLVQSQISKSTLCLDTKVLYKNTFFFLKLLPQFSRPSHLLKTSVSAFLLVLLCPQTQPDFFIALNCSEDLFSICLSLPSESKLSEFAGVFCILFTFM